MHVLLLLTARCPLLFFASDRTWRTTGPEVYGFVMDRELLHALFMIEFSLVMWLLGKTVGIS
jgi:hypothetical protein